MKALVRRSGNGRALGAVCLGVTLSLVAALSGCYSSAEGAAAEQVALPRVSVTEVEARSAVLWDSFTGRVAAPETVDLRPRVSGYIERVAFQEGTLVEQGDVLFEIDPRPYQASVESARAELARAQSQLELAASQARRARALLGGKAISREVHDQRRAAESAARAALQSAQAKLDSALLDLEYTRVKAPITGRVGRAQVTRGNLASANQTLLTTVVSTHPMYVYFDADQQTLLHNPNVLGGMGGTEVQVGLAGESGLPHSGLLDFVDNQLNGQAGTIQLRAVVDNLRGVFRAGQFARVKLPTAYLDNALMIDRKAVMIDQDRRYVYVVNSDDLVERREVQPGREVDGLLVIKQGLQQGDRVIVNGLHRISGAGSQVDVEMLDAAPQYAASQHATDSSATL